MNKVFHYYYSKKPLNSVSSRGLGSSSGIIKLSGNCNNINLESTIKKNLLSSNNNTSIKDGQNIFNTNNNQIKNTKNNNITTLPETNNNQNLFMNNKDINTNSTPKEINFDFYKVKDNSEQTDKSNNIMNKNSTTIKNEEIKNNNLTSGNKINNDNNKFSSIKHINILTKKNKVDFYKKSLSSNLSSDYINKNPNFTSINKTSENNLYGKKL